MQIVQYIEGMLAGQSPDEALPEIQRYLAAHPTQAQEIRELVAMFQADQADDWVEPKSQPAFDLSFLAGHQPPSPATLPEQIQSAFAGGRAWLFDQLGVLWVDFAATIRLQPPPPPVLATRSAQEAPGAPEEDLLYQLSLGREELGDLDLEVKAIRAENPAFCTFIITAWAPARWPNLGGVEVVVLGSASPRTGVTDEDGQVVFDKIPVADLAQISIQVNPARAQGL
jgi:hypothetical protein